MKIDIDFEMLKQTGISADDFIYLYLLHRKEINYLNNLNLRPNLENLHAKDPDAQANLKSKLRYRKIIGTKVYKHKHIIECLNKQLLIERNSLSYFQNLETWINNHTWEKYENLDEHDTGETTTRITRSL